MAVGASYPASIHPKRGPLARVLIVGCGCRGQALAADLLAAGHAVRGTTRDPARAAAIAAAGAEPAVADPDRLATLTPLVEGISVVCWVLGTVEEPALHGPRLASFLEHLVDTPVRGVVYETGGVERPEAARAAAHARATYRMPVELVGVPPARLAGWREAMGAAVLAVLSG